MEHKLTGPCGLFPFRVALSFTLDNVVLDCGLPVTCVCFRVDVFKYQWYNPGIEESESDPGLSFYCDSNPLKTCNEKSLLPYFE